MFDLKTMNEPRALSYFGVAATAAILLLVTLKNVVIGTPDAKLPAGSLFFTPDESAWEATPRELASADFEQRPLFSESRRPFVPVTKEVPAADSAPTRVPKQTLKGWALLGIFNSGEVEGAIIRQQDGTRRRMLVGDIAGGWRLLLVEPRRAVFRSERSADEAELTMSLVSLDGLIRNVPAAPALGGSVSDVPSEEAAAVESPASAVEQRAEQAPKRRDPTVFGGMHRDV